MSQISEATLKSELAKLARVVLAPWIIFRHEDKFTHGVPDFSITGNRRTSWLEAKFANPKFETKGIQELTMLRLAKNGIAFYPVYSLVDGCKMTYLVHPSEIGKPRTTWSNCVEGFNHLWVLEEVKKEHYR